MKRIVRLQILCVAEDHQGARYPFNGLYDGFDRARVARPLAVVSSYQTLPNVCATVSSGVTVVAPIVPYVRCLIVLKGAAARIRPCALRKL
jgi:hypothetical protein